MASIHELGWHEWLTKSNFSFLVGASHPEELLKEALSKGYRSFCLNDYDGVYGIARAFRRQRQLKEAFPEASFELRYGAEIHLEKDHNKPVLLQNTLVLLAQSWRGYAHLCKILSYAHRESKSEGFISLEALCTFEVEDLVAIQPMRGLLRHPALSPEAKLKHYSQIRDHFKGRYSWALTKVHHPAEDAWMQKAYEFQKALDLPLLFSQDIFFHTSERKSLSDLLHAIRTNTELKNASAHFFPNSERSFHSLKALENRYQNLPGWSEALIHSQELFENSRWCLSELKYQYPKEMIPETHTAQSFLEELTWQGLKKRIQGSLSDKLKEKVLHELTLIRELDFADYFLTVWDIVRWARAQSILCQGRGSAANSIVCWALEITSVNPQQFDLLMERFISKERGDPPDIDVDFEHERREEVLQYIYARYGRKRAAMVANIITFRGKGARRAVGKAMGLSEEALNHMSQAAKSKFLAQQKSEDFTKDVKESLSGATPFPEHFSWELWQEMVKLLKGFPRHLGLHSGGFVISQNSLDELVPQEPATMEGRTVIQWAKDDLEGMGFFKIDLLALGMLTAIRKSFEMIKEHEAKDLELYSLPDDDPQTYEMICNADTVGVFQIESRAQMSMLPRLKPKEFYDLVIEVAIIRPGPIQGKVIHPYLERREGLAPVSYPKLLEPVLKRTLGIAIFQEQAMRVAILAGDFSPGEANELRRHIGVWNSKDFSRDLDPWLTKLERGMKQKGISEEFIEQIVGQMKGFAHYGFPESHAVSFALLAYASSYLKCHHPEAFFASVMNSQPMGFYSVYALTQAAKREGVIFLPISIQHSTWDHQLEKTAAGKLAIRLGFRVVRSLREQAANHLVETRSALGGRFTDFDSFLKHTALYRDALTALAASGAFSDFGLSRSEALWATEAYPLRPLVDEEDQHFEWKSENILHALQRDLKATGLSLGPHPTELFAGHFGVIADHPKLFIKALDLQKSRNGATVHTFGMLVIRQAPGSAKGMVFVTLEDATGFINLAFTPQVYEKYFRLIDFSSFLCVRGRIQKVGSYHSILVQEVYPEDSGRRKVKDLKYAKKDGKVLKVASPQRSYY